jgi:hypothetical protein
MKDTDIIRQQSINSLMNFITEQVFITKNKRSIEFQPMAYYDQSSEGRFILDGCKEGSYHIYYDDNLKLTIKSKSDFNFKFNSTVASDFVLLDSKRNDTDAILLSIKNLVVE